MILVECCDYDGSVVMEIFNGLMKAEEAVEEVVKSIPDHPDNVSYKCTEISVDGIPIAEHTYSKNLVIDVWAWASRPLLNDPYLKKWRSIRKGV